MSFAIFPYIFEKVFKTLTGRKLITEYLSSVCLSKGEGHTVLALSGSIPLLKLLLIAILMVRLRFLKIVFTCANSLSIPVDFLLSSCSISQVETFGRFFSILISFIALILS